MKKWSLFLFSMLCLTFQMSSWAIDLEHIPRLTVKGEASIFKPSDQMEVSLGVVTADEESSTALNENNKRMHQIIANLQTLGLDETEYQTGRFNIRPIYQKPSKESSEEESKQISRYEVINLIDIKTQKIELADKIISAAVQAGANQLDKVHFNINNPQAYRTEAIQVAAQNALADASALANAVGVKLKRIINVSLDHWQQLPGSLMLSKRSEEGGSFTGDAIEVGKAEIHAVVSLTFEISQ